MDAIVAFDEEDFLPAPVSVRDPALEATLWGYRVVNDGDPGGPWRLDVWREQAWDGTGYRPGWAFGGRWPHRIYAERAMLEGARETVHQWRSSMCRAFHVDYRLERVERTATGTVLVERVRRHFWDEPKIFDGYVAA